jgi:hypothetical protein
MDSGRIGRILDGWFERVYRGQRGQGGVARQDRDLRLSEEGQPHDRPHCHVYWPGGESVVALDRVEILAGNIPSAAVLTLRREHLALIKEAWTTLNPRRPVT